MHYRLILHISAYVTTWNPLLSMWAHVQLHRLLSLTTVFTVVGKGVFSMTSTVTTVGYTTQVSPRFCCYYVTHFSSPGLCLTWVRYLFCVGDTTTKRYAYTTSTTSKAVTTTTHQDGWSGYKGFSCICGDDDDCNEDDHAVNIGECNCFWCIQDCWR